MNPFVTDYLAAFHKGAQSKIARTVRLGSRPKPQGTKAEDIVPMDTTGGAFSDYMLPMSTGGYRAGKSEALASATGQDPGFAVTHPITSMVLAQIGVGIPVAAMGGAAGQILGQSYEASRFGAGVGATTGMLLGTLMMGKMRRNSMRDINRGFDEASTINPSIRTINPFSVLSGSHDRGRAVGVDALTGGSGATPLTPGLQAGMAEVPYQMLNMASGPAVVSPALSQGIGLGSLLTIPPAVVGSIVNKAKASRTNRDMMRSEPKAIRIVQQ